MATTLNEVWSDISLARRDVINDKEYDDILATVSPSPTPRKACSRVVQLSHKPQKATNRLTMATP